MIPLNNVTVYGDVRVVVKHASSFMGLLGSLSLFSFFFEWHPRKCQPADVAACRPHVID